jgi:threonine/homoserine/homoserine lactone efflux protein
MAADVVTFLGIVVVLAITPGADMALVMRNVLAAGFRTLWPTMAGIVSSLAVHITLCVAGLSVVLRDSEVAFTTVKLVGAAWLAWMGIGAIIEAWRVGRGRTTPDSVARAETAASSARTMFLRGFLTNLLNVKIALFYIAFLPQFAPAGDRFVPVALGLATAQVLVGITWLTIYATIIARAGAAINGSPRTRRWLEGSTGAALLGFGLRLATAGR